MTALDFIGDVHGCTSELHDLLQSLGYSWKHDTYIHREGRKPVFIGDITDRGPQSIAAIELVSHMVGNNYAYYVPGNHCDKLYRFFLGRNVKIAHGLETTVAELEGLSNRDYKRIRKSFMDLFETAPLYLALDNNRVIAAHAGIREDLIGHSGKKVRTFVLYGDITGEQNSDGTPVRRDWAVHYQGTPLIVYGHTPVLEPRKIGNTVNIDTGCVFGGKLTALRYPEMTYSQVPSTLAFFPEKFRSFE